MPIDDEPRWPRGAPDDAHGHGQGGRWVAAASIALLPALAGRTLLGFMRGRRAGAGGYDLPGGTDARTHLSAVFEGHDPRTGYTTRVTGASGTSRHISVIGGISDQHGRDIGSWTVVMNRDGSVEIPEVDIWDQEHQGQGLTTAWLEDQVFPALKQHGFKTVHLLANIDVGGYAWAKAGFDWDMEEENNPIYHPAFRIIGQAVMDLQRGQLTGLSDESVAELRAMMIRIERGQIPTPGEIARLGRRQRDRDHFEGYPLHRADGTVIDMWLGKHLLLGRAWHGVMKL